MTLRPRQKIPAPGVSSLDQDDDSSDVTSCTFEDSFITCSPLITTTPSPNVFDSNQLSHEQAQDPAINRIIS
ncbi:unnamed protein product, partial [Rotaria magnacalcarata]